MSALYESVIKPSMKALVPFVPERVTPNQITITGGICALLAGVCVANGKKLNFLNLIGGIFYFLYVIFDNLDGTLARERCLCSEFGQFLDHFIDGTVGIGSFSLIFHKISSYESLTFENLGILSLAGYLSFFLRS